MTKIVKKHYFNQQTILLELLAPEIALKAKAGQFIIFRIDQYGERVPLTIHDVDMINGTISIVFQTIGKSTTALGQMLENQEILDVVGPLGHPTQLNGYQNVCVVVGGLGSAIGFLCAKQLFNDQVNVDIVAGFRAKELVILEDKMKTVSQNLYICSDDGSIGYHGFVSQQLMELLTTKSYDLVLTIGPLMMMKSVANVTKKLRIKTMASMNPIMVDGSGMCGCCRVSVNGITKFACVEGPDFDAHQVDFDELIIRNRFYLQQEKQAKDHYCKLLQEKIYE